MPSEQLRFILESIASVASIAALVAIALELQRARRADAREFLSRATDKFHAAYDSYRLLSTVEFSSVDEFLLWPHDEPEFKAFVRVHNFWNTLATEIMHNPSEKKIAIETFGQQFYYFYEQWSPLLKGVQEIAGAGSNADASSLDWFAQEYMKKLPGDWEAAQRVNEYAENLRAQNS